MQTRYVYTDHDLANLLNEMGQKFVEHGSLVVKFDKAPRSIPQNDTFHMWCEEFAKGMTNKGRPTDPKTAKLWMKHKFLGYEDVPMGNSQIKEQLRHTSDLSMAEYYWFMEQMWEYCATEFEIFLTIPSEGQFMKMRRKQNAQD